MYKMDKMDEIDKINNINGQKLISKDSKRIETFDIARTFAIICVILCHCIESVYEMSVSGINSLSFQSKIFCFGIFTLGRMGVPIFLFLSGALLLKKQIECDEHILKFYRKNLLPLLISNEIWIIIYNIFNFISGSDINIGNIVKELLFIKQVPMTNMWYMPMIIGVYFAIPFVAKIVKSFSLKTLLPCIVVVFIYSSLLPTLNVFFKIFNQEHQNLGYVIDLNFLGGLYGIYIILGYIISKGRLKKINWYSCTLISLLFFVFTVATEIFSYKKQIKFKVWYDFSFLIIASIFLFELFRRVKSNNKVLISLTKQISEWSLAIFFLHIIIISILRKYIIELQIIMPMKVLILFIITLIACLTIITILNRIKIVRKHIFLIKN